MTPVVLIPAVSSVGICDSYLGLWNDLGCIRLHCICRLDLFAGLHVLVLGSQHDSRCCYVRDLYTFMHTSLSVGVFCTRLPCVCEALWVSSPMKFCYNLGTTVFST